MRYFTHLSSVFFLIVLFLAVPGSPVGASFSEPLRDCREPSASEGGITSRP